MNIIYRGNSPNRLGKQCSKTSPNSEKIS
ncbi:hypothetical protein Zm00014a_029551 [Zea mays]|uniref:Uncharacterized protein n=1 Tax=Zea mays TaxID=4577 RepID=A0A317Y8X9_MAIZE|nr:hypothetical protein Zm00014a_029551 [Zea mays]